MTATDDELKTLPPEVQPWVRFAKVAVKILAAAALAIGPAVTAYRSAAGDAAERTQATKNKAEAGYQVTRAAMEAFEHRIAELEAAQRAPAPKKGRKVPTPAAVLKGKALPGDLDKAERQVYRGVAAAGVSPDAGRPNER